MRSDLGGQDQSGFLSALLDTDPNLKRDLEAISTEAGFVEALQLLDLHEFSSQFKLMTEHLTAYNVFHLRETRLWSLKLGTGRIPQHLEETFKKTVPDGIERLQNTFNGADRCLDMLDQSGLTVMFEKHLDKLTRRYAFEKETVFGQATMGYFKKLGFSAPMVEEFTTAFRPIHCEFVRALGGGHLSKVRAVAEEAVQARVKLLELTEKEGFSYIRGSGPPAWAVFVSEALAAVGIGISAWVIVAIIATIVVTLVLLCVAGVLPIGVCDTLAALGIIVFTFPF